MKWVMVILGVVLFLAPFLSGYSGQAGMLWFSLIAGAVVAVLGYFKNYKWAAVAGLIIFVAPWIFGFGGTAAAIWCWIIGAATTLLAGYKGFFADRKAPQTGGSV